MNRYQHLIKPKVFKQSVGVLRFNAATALEFINGFPGFGIGQNLRCLIFNVFADLSAIKSVLSHFLPPLGLIVAQLGDKCKQHRPNGIVRTIFYTIH